VGGDGGKEQEDVGGGEGKEREDTLLINCEA
jgi:hypothetical protein